MVGVTPLKSAAAMSDRLLHTTLVILRIGQFASAAAAIILCFSTAPFWLFPALRDAYMEKVSDPYALLLLTSAALSSAIMFGIVFMILSHLIRVVKTVSEGNAFTSKNAKRLRIIAYLIFSTLVIEFMLSLIYYFCVDSTRYGSRSFDWDPSSIITILILFVLARVFEEGVRLNDEAQFTV